VLFPEEKPGWREGEEAADESIVKLVDLGLERVRVGGGGGVKLERSESVLRVWLQEWGEFYGQLVDG